MKALAILLLSILTLHAQVTSDDLRNIQFDQKPAAQVKMNLPFVDETGNNITLAAAADGRPVVLAMGYYECPMLCTLELNGLVSALQDIKASTAEKASIIFVSIDPKETPALAAAKKASYMKLYGRKEAAGEWHFLTGSKDSIAQLADEVGFRFVYDSARRQFAHPSGLMILTPEGKVSRYFFGVNYAANDLISALKQANARQTGGVIQQFVYLCFHMDPIRGKYGPAVLMAVRIGGVATLLGLAAIIVLAQRSGKEGG